MPAPTEETIGSLVVTKQGEAWIATESAIFRSANHAWVQVAAANGARLGIDRSGALWATWDDALWHFDGVGFQRVADAPAGLVATRFDRPVVGWSGFHRWDGLRFQGPQYAGGGQILDVEVAADGSLWVLTTRREYNDPEFVFLTVVDGADGSIRQVWEERGAGRGLTLPTPRAIALLDDGGILLVGENGRTIEMRDGQAHEAPRKGVATALFPVADDDVHTFVNVFGGANASYRWTPARWSGGAGFNGWHDGDLGGTAPDDVWAVGQGHLQHWDGETHTRWEGEATYRALFAIARDDVWAAGDDGTVAHWDGDRWTESGTGTKARFTDVWAGGPEDIFLGGQTILHGDGESWHVPPGIPAGDLHISTLAGSGPADVWAAGERLWHGNGRTWTEVESPGRPLHVWTAGGEAVFLVTRQESGPPSLHRRQGGGWRELPLASPWAIAGPPGRGTAAFGSMLARFCREDR